MQELSIVVSAWGLRHFQTTSHSQQTTSILLPYICITISSTKALKQWQFNSVQDSVLPAWKSIPFAHTKKNAAFNSSKLCMSSLRAFVEAWCFEQLLSSSHIPRLSVGPGTACDTVRSYKLNSQLFTTDTRRLDVRSLVHLCVRKSVGCRTIVHLMWVQSNRVVKCVLLLTVRLSRTFPWYIGYVDTICLCVCVCVYQPFTFSLVGRSCSKQQLLSGSLAFTPFCTSFSTQFLPSRQTAAEWSTLCTSFGIPCVMDRVHFVFTDTAWRDFVVC